MLGNNLLLPLSLRFSITTSLSPLSLSDSEASLAGSHRGQTFTNNTAPQKKIKKKGEKRYGVLGKGGARHPHARDACSTPSVRERGCLFRRSNERPRCRSTTPRAGESEGKGAMPSSSSTQKQSKPVKTEKKKKKKHSSCFLSKHPPPPPLTMPRVTSPCLRSESRSSLRPPSSPHVSPTKARQKRQKLKIRPPQVLQQYI